eukprot:1138389-Pelagomonas_calceolata.AAC.1
MLLNAIQAAAQAEHIVKHSTLCTSSTPQHPFQTPVPAAMPHPGHLNSIALYRRKHTLVMGKEVELLKYAQSVMIQVKQPARTTGGTNCSSTQQCGKVPALCASGASGTTTKVSWLHATEASETQNTKRGSQGSSASSTGIKSFVFFDAHKCNIQGRVAHMPIHGASSSERRSSLPAAHLFEG